MVRFDPMANHAISHVMLFEQAIWSGAVPQAYSYCSNRNSTSRFIVYAYLQDLSAP